METISTRLSRRDFLNALPVTVVATSLPGGAASADLENAYSLDRIERLMRELSDALLDHDRGRWFATVYPADHVGEPIELRTIQSVLDAKGNVSPELRDLICAHCAAYSGLGRASTDADTMNLAGNSTTEEVAQLDQAIRRERDLFKAICRYPARNDPERNSKAVYLLGISQHDPMDAEHVASLLVSMTSPPEQPDWLGAGQPL